MNYSNARSVFTSKRWRYSTGEKTAVIYCSILGLFLLFGSIVSITPLDDSNTQVYGLLNSYLIKSAIIIFGSWLCLILWSVSYRFKAFIHQSIGFKENEALFSVFLLIVLTSAYIAIGDMTLLLKNNITYTMKLSSAYFFTSLMLLVWIIYTLRRGIINAKRLSKASVLSMQQETQEEDAESFRDHLSNTHNWGLF